MGNELAEVFAYQDAGSPLAGKDRGDAKAIILVEGTGVELRKSVTKHWTSGGGFYQVYFVEVVSGEYGGERGWIHERFLLRE